MAIIQATPRRTVNPLESLQIEAEYLNTPAARRARLAGLLEAKQEAHQNAAHLARWARPLAIAVVLTSGLHIWETLAAVAPARVEAMMLPAWAYHFSALLLVLMIDSSIVFLAAATSTAAYVGHRHQTAALPLLYATTGLLNLAYLARYMPGMPSALRDPALALLAVVFVLLLAALVPVVLVAIERAAHTLQAAKLALGVEVATLKGLVAADTDRGHHEEQPQQEVQEGSTHHITGGQFDTCGTIHPRVFSPASKDALQALATAQTATSSTAYTCPRCGAALTAGQLGAATRHGHCRHCKNG